MKCGHCAANLERQEWFCPNCKRGRQNPSKGARTTRRSAGLLVTVGVAFVALGATLGGRWNPTEAVAAVTPSAEAPVVVIREATTTTSTPRKLRVAAFAATEDGVRPATGTIASPTPTLTSIPASPP